MYGKSPDPKSKGWEPVTSRVTRCPRPLGMPLARDKEKQERGIIIFGGEVTVPGLAAAGGTLCVPPGKVFWIPPSQAELLTALLAIGQPPEATPRKNPVTGRIGRQKSDGKGVGNDTKRWWSWDRSPFPHR